MDNDQNLTTSETDDLYKYVIRKTETARLVVTDCGRQYAVQLRDGKDKDGRPKWRCKKYCSQLENIAEACEQLGLPDLAKGLTARI